MYAVRPSSKMGNTASPTTLSPATTVQVALSAKRTIRAVLSLLGSTSGMAFNLGVEPERFKLSLTSVPLPPAAETTPAVAETFAMM